MTKNEVAIPLEALHIIFRLTEMSEFWLFVCCDWLIVWTEVCEILMGENDLKENSFSGMKFFNASYFGIADVKFETQ